MSIDRRRFLLCCGAGFVPRIERPELATDEGGLWAYMDREEEKVKRSPFLLRDPALNDYVRGIACRLAGEHCADLRVYLLRTPLFNASMAPNGMMQVWSGLLVRMANEAQLAAMLAHEIGHYVARHSVERLRDAKSRSALGQLVSIALSPAAFLGTALSSAAQLGLATGGLAYAREHEREADRIGLELMARAGYAPKEAAEVWAQLGEEAKGGGNVLFASHPPAAERQAALAELAAAIPASGRVGSEAYRAAIAPQRALFLHDEVQRRRFEESMVLFDRLQRVDPRDGEVKFFVGEAHRLRDDLDRALIAYENSEAMKGAPPELYRSKGLVLRRLGRHAEASQSFARYLELRPAAVDAELVRTYL